MSLVPGCPNHPSLPTILILRPLQCLTLLPTPIISDPPLPEDLLDGPWGPPWAMRVNSLVEGHPTVDLLGDGARRWTTSPPSTETGTTTITTTMWDPHPKLKIYRTIPMTHWHKLDIQKPKPFTGRDPWKWQIFLTQCLTMFQAKPITFQLESSRVAFAMSYLQGIAFNHYTALLQFNPNNPVLSNWLAFTQEFLSKFGIFDTIAEVEEISSTSECVTTNTSQPLLYDLNGKPTRLAGTTMLSDSPSIVPCLNKSRTSFALHPSKPPTMGTRRSLLRSTNITGKIAAKTQHPGPRGMPPVTPTGRPEQPTAFGPQSLLTPPTLCPIFPQAEKLPAPINPQDNVCLPSSMPLTSMKLQNPWTPTPMTTTTFWTLPMTKKPYA
ncbi:hypothetical protein C0989_005494 [Termitomyces sp. Mn162]|nr:hypothetical protein C0989_005494 [Termitomyces sp. Mn162]